MKFHAYYASTANGTDEMVKQHQVLVFQYHYVHEVQVRNKGRVQPVKLTQVHKDLLGGICF